MDISYYKKYEPIFGSWHIVRELGSGSYGKVFELERIDDYDGEKYSAALKAITIPQSESELDSVMDSETDEESATAYFKGVVDELVNEFKLMALLEGESNIVSYKDHRVVRHTDGVGWDILILMELLTPLVKYTRGRDFGREDVIRLGTDMCKALELCRTYNIVHRDIKPENIFVSNTGKFKLGDFGIAKTVEKTMGGLSKKGTYSYMAPEVYKGERYGASVDIYSLGIVLYRYSNFGRLPFLPLPPAKVSYADSAAALERRIINAEPLPAPANADAQIASVILKACAYDPRDRYQSAAELLEALETVKNNSAAYDAPKAAPVAENEDPERTTGIFYTREPATVPAEEKTTCIFTEKPETDTTVNLFVPPDEAPTALETDVKMPAYPPPVPEGIPVQLPKEHRQPLAETPKAAAPAAKPKKKKRIILAALAALLILGGVLGIALSGGKTDVVDTGNDPTAEQTPTPTPKVDVIDISAGYAHTVGLKSDGTVVAVGDNYAGRRNVSGWRDIVAVSAGYAHTVGLKSDGTVVAVGDSYYGQCDVSGWTDIVAVSAGSYHTVGLKSDGTVVAVGPNSDGLCDVSGWTNIVAVSAGVRHTVGLKSDGTVVAVGHNECGQCDVSDWTDIVAVSAGLDHTVGLKSDGTVVAVGYNGSDQCDVSGWKDIVAFSAGSMHTVGLKSDGTVVAVGYNEYGQCDVSGWKDIVAVSAGYGHTVGLKSDGTVVAVGWNERGQCDVSDWR